MKPIITAYSSGTSEGTKKFEGYISAAFWIGIDHAENELGSVKIRQPVQSYDDEVENLKEFVSLMVERQINFSIEFFAEPTAAGQEEGLPPDDVIISAPREPELDAAGDFQERLTQLKEEYGKGTISKKQYESRRSVLLKRWKEKVEGKMGQ